MSTAVSRKRKGKEKEHKVTAALPLGKQLAHTDKHVRDGAIANLVAFLSRGAPSDPYEDANESSEDGRTGERSYVPLNVEEMDKLWKGLFYCFWMSDKPLVQQALARDLAELVLLIRPEKDEDRFSAAVDFLAGFWRAIVREWEGIDRLRIDKFYLLLRRYTIVTFRLLAREQWSSSSIESVNTLLSKGKGPISYEDKSVASSIATHLADVFLDELDQTLSLPEVSSQPPCPLISLLQPHIDLLAHTPTQTVHTRVMSTLFQPLLDALHAASPDPEEAERPRKKRKDEPMYAHIIMECSVDGNNKASSVQLRKALLQALFHAASQEDALDVNRRKIYKVCREEGGDDED
ncbi:nucleolar protein,Nop52-domain-containing protein [Kockovaella imperatae]|uniref:Nucleolar protein,Nop52-domain-containing protein n=1 Tax=Kockovaella imperatae TaxID=4999 RepID=A0A1Y1UJI3_9TREE|nr:nucleolar protein,Nop52-domain-containing protein [Kockovaella imperatae]ORX37697.1 nucleolar protein,Nop52-domain-containing protein [Kockovaella imperatae]